MTMIDALAPGIRDITSRDQGRARLLDAMRYRMPLEILTEWRGAPLVPEALAEVAPAFLRELARCGDAGADYVDMLTEAIAYGSLPPARRPKWPFAAVAMSRVEIEVDVAFRVADVLRAVGLPMLDVLVAAVRAGARGR